MKLFELISLAATPVEPPKAENTTLLGEPSLPEPEKMDVDKTVPEETTTTQSPESENKVPETDSNPMLLPIAAAVAPQPASDDHTPPGI